MPTPDVSSERLAIDGLVATAGELAATARILGRATHRQQRALDRWYAGWARGVRQHLELVEADVLPTVTARRPLDDDLLESFAAGHAWIDELIGDLGDALGIVGFRLGDVGQWIERTAILADRLATLLGLEADRQHALLAELDDGARRVVAVPTGLRSRVERSVRRFRAMPIAGASRN